MNGAVRIVGILMQLMGLIKLVDMPLVALLVIGLGCFATYQWRGVEVMRLFSNVDELVGHAKDLLASEALRNEMGLAAKAYYQKPVAPAQSVLAVMEDAFNT